MQSIFDALVNNTPDIAVAYDPTTYKEPTGGGFKLLPPGNYRGIILPEHVSSRKTQSGETILQDGWPKLVIEKVTLVAPVERTVVLYADIRTKPYTRKDGTTGSDLLDWIRAYDAGAEGLGSRNSQLAALSAFLQDARPITFRLDWEAYDKEFIAAVKASGNLPNDDDYAKARIKGAKAFDSTGFGEGPVHPDGETRSALKAQYRIAQFYSSLTAPTTRLARVPE
jgi:hypothetical protein